MLRREYHRHAVMDWLHQRVGIRSDQRARFERLTASFPPLPQASKGKGAMLAEDPTTEISSLNCREVMQSRDLGLGPGQPLDLPAASVTSLRLSIA